MADDSWRTHAFRQNVVAKIEEAIRQSGMNTSRNSIEMENHVFQKAKNKEEYLSFVARLILHVREMNSKKGQPGPMNGVPGGQQQQAPGMPDPINALQNLASQGSRNAMVGMGGPPQQGQMGPGQGAANLLQTLNRGPGGQQIMMGGGMPGSMPMQVPRMQNMGMPPNSQMPGQMPMQLQNQMGAQMGGQMSAQMQSNSVGRDNTSNLNVESTAREKCEKEEIQEPNENMLYLEETDDDLEMSVISLDSPIASPSTLSEDSSGPLESQDQPIRKKRRINSSAPNPTAELLKEATTLLKKKNLEAEKISDHISVFADMITSEMRRINDAGILNRLKRKVTRLIFDSLDEDQILNNYQ